MAKAAPKNKTKTKSALLEKYMKDRGEHSAIMSESEVFNNNELIPTDVPMMNIAFGGSFDGGLPGGVTLIAGPSRHFKTSFGLVGAAAFQKKYPEGIVIFYDSEYGSPPDYLESYDVDPDRVIHEPILTVEDLKFKIQADLEKFSEGDKVMFFIDSLGGLASKKEASDAKEEKSAADMTRAKELKSLFHIITPQINLYKIPVIGIAHTYQTMEMFSKTILGGGQGMMLAANTVWFVTKSKNKDSDKNLEGSTFTIKAEKSRFVKEESKFPIEVSFEDGIKKYSGLIELAVGFGLVEETKISRSKAYGFEGKVYEAADIAMNDDFWKLIFEKTNFKELVENKYSLSKSDTSGIEFGFEKDE